MRNRNILSLLAIAIFTVSGLASSADAQAKPPKQEILLNGLKVLLFNEPAAQQVTVRLRVHAGSAFDPLGKEGVMRMLSETIFLTDEAREYFKDDLGGSFEVVSNYDYLQLNVTGRTDTLIPLLETLANAVSSPQINKESTDAAKERVRRDLDLNLGNAAYLADQTASEKLFGAFPYGRSKFGTADSHRKIDFADLRFAYDRFFGADNATIAISGNIDPNTTYRAVRRFLGAWLKSDRRVPSTFKQPTDPDTSLTVLNLRADSGAEVRHVIRGFSKADLDFAASEVLTTILDKRLKDRVAKVSNAKAAVRNEAHILPGQIVFSVSGIATDAKIKLYPAGDSVDPKGLIASLFTEPITSAEFATARAAIVSATNAKPLDERWIDLDTYKLGTSPTQIVRVQALTLSDVQKLADSLKTRPAVNLWMVKGIGS